MAPPPRAQKADKRIVEADEQNMSAFVFKIQANMDPNHRDRIAFARLCSGKLTRGMKVKQVRTGKSISLNAPQFFFAQDRSVADEAYAGDVVGIPNHGAISIGDTLTEGEDFNFLGVPNFAPEILRRVRLPDAMKAKKLKEALQQLAEEGVVQVFRPQDGSPALVGVVGPLQLDVLRVRLKDEYGLEVLWDTAEFALARWIAADDPKVLTKFIADNGLSIADDLDGDPVYLARNDFYLGYTRERAPGIVFTDVKDRHANGKAGSARSHRNGLLKNLDPQPITPRQLRRLGDADADAGGDLGRAFAGVKLERQAVERQPVVRAGDSHRLRQAAGSGAEQPLVIELAPPAHLGQALQRLDGADQHRAGRALRLADEIQAPVDAVGAVHVGKAGRAEHHGVALGSAPEAVRRRVGVVIGLDLDDQAADVVDEQRGPDQFGGDLVDAAGEERAAESAERHRVLQCGYSCGAAATSREHLDYSPPRTQPCRDLAIPFTEIEAVPSCCDISCFFSRIG